MKQVKLICTNCEVEFSKAQKEYDRQVRQGRDPAHFFCSRSCDMLWKNANVPGLTEAAAERVRSSQEKATKSASNRNTKGVFTYYLRKARQRKKGQWDETNLDEEYLQQLWDNQKGCCAWTGTEMVPIIKGHVVDYFSSASLDRICSTVGYVKGNVQFVLLPLNYAKGSADEDDFRYFLQSINASPRG